MNSKEKEDNINVDDILDESDSSSDEAVVEDKKNKGSDSDESVDEDERAAILADLEASDSADEDEGSVDEDSSEQSSSSPKSRKGSIGGISINSLTNKSIESDPKELA